VPLVRKVYNRQYLGDVTLRKPEVYHFLAVVSRERIDQGCRIGCDPPCVRLALEGFSHA
jgi:hypothetical protein